MNRLNLIAMTIIGLLSNFSTASVRFENVLSISNQPNYLRVDDLRLLNFGSDDTICLQVIEVQGTYLCIPKQKFQMNQTFTRMGFFWGAAKGMRAGTLVPNHNSLLAQYNQVISGHNLPGEVILHFLKAADLSPDLDVRLNALERDFAKTFISKDQVQKLNGRFYLIVVSADQPENFNKTLEHELNHARYHLQSAHREAVDKFWRDFVSEEDKVGVRTMLGQYYNADNESLMIDEFHAYILEAEADDENRPLRAYVSRYQKPLLDALKNAGSTRRLQN